MFLRHVLYIYIDCIHTLRDMSGIMSLYVYSNCLKVCMQMLAQIRVFFCGKSLASGGAFIFLLQGGYYLGLRRCRGD